MRLEEFFRRYARGRGVLMAERLRVVLRDIVNTPAPLRRTRSGRLVAATRARPYAPPRRVTGNLRNKIRVVRTTHGARVVCWAPYGVPLETSHRYLGWPHAFWRIGLSRLKITGRHSAPWPWS